MNADTWIKDSPSTGIGQYKEAFLCTYETFHMHCAHINCYFTRL